MNAMAVRVLAYRGQCSIPAVPLDGRSSRDRPPSGAGLDSWAPTAEWLRELARALGKPVHMLTD